MATDPRPATIHLLGGPGDGERLVLPAEVADCGEFHRFTYPHLGRDLASGRDDDPEPAVSPRSLAPVEITEDRFLAYLKHASEKVATWPEWRRNILGGIDPDASFSRGPAGW